MTKFEFSVDVNPYLLANNYILQLKFNFVIFISRIHHIALGRKEPDLARGVERRAQP